MSLRIPIEPGQTEIDLAPILVPIVRGILNKTSTAHGNHWIERGAELFIKEAFEEHELDNRIEALQEAWVLSYLRDKGWRCKPDTDEGCIHCETRKKVPDPKPDWWFRQSTYEQSHHVNVYPDGHKWKSSKFNSHRRGLLAIAEHEGRHLEEIVEDIEAYAPPLAQLARTAE